MGAASVFGYGLFILACFTVVPFEAVTVSPSICPTNKIAPHKRQASWPYGTGRTFGAFYDLLTPGGNGPYYGPQNNLQEQPQEDDSNDCGEIEDYDENDLDSIVPPRNRRQGYRAGPGFYFGDYDEDQPSPYHHQHHKPQHSHKPGKPQRPPSNNQKPEGPSKPQRPPSNPPKPPAPQRPQVPPRPQKPPVNKPLPPLRPPYWSGGHFESNGYRPPPPQKPSDSIKPIHEHTDNSDVIYKPTLVGGSLGHIVGVTPIIPSTEEQNFYNSGRVTTQSSNYLHQTRRPRSRNINGNVLGSFVDLFFK